MALLRGDLFARMRDWLKGSLGHADYSASIIAEQWDAFLAELKQLHEQEAEFTSTREVTRNIEGSGAANWARRLRTEPVTGESDTLLPTNWKEAWQWSHQRGYLQAIDEVSV